MLKSVSNHMLKKSSRRLLIETGHLAFQVDLAMELSDTNVEM